MRFSSKKEFRQTLQAFPPSSVFLCPARVVLASKKNWFEARESETIDRESTLECFRLRCLLLTSRLAIK